MTYTRYKRIKAALVYVVAAALIASPLRRADAFVAPAAAPILVTAAGPVAWTAAALSALVVGGVALWALKFKDSGGTDRLTVHLNAKSPKPVPVNWSAGTNPYDAPVPPGTANSITEYQGFGVATWQSTLQAAINEGCVAAGRGPTGSVVSGLVYNCAVPYSGCDAAHLNNCVSATTRAVCPVGYTLSGGVCTLTNASVVPYPSDGMGQKAGTSGVFADDSRDPDNALPGNVTATSSQITVKANGTTTTLTINGNGGYTLTSVVPNGNGTSTKTSITTSAPSVVATDGGVNAAGSVQSTVTGEGDSATDTSAPASCGGEPCATEGTQLANKALLQDMQTNGVKIKEDAGAWATAKSDADTKIATAQSVFTTHENKLTTIAGGGNSSGLGVTGLSNYVAPSSGDSTGLEAMLPSASSCQAMTGTAFGRSWSVDICPVVNATRVVLEWGLYVLTAVYIFFVFLRQRERGS